MSALMARSKVRSESVDDVEAAIEKVFAAIEREQPEGVRYTACKLADGVTFVALLELADPSENPLLALPEFREFQENLKGWIDGPPDAGPLTPVASYRFFEWAA